MNKGIMKSFQLGSELAADVRAMRSALGADSDAEVIRRALELLKIASEAQDIILTREDGRKVRVIVRKNAGRTDSSPGA